jgi:hypothetical protein
MRRIAITCLAALLGVVGFAPLGGAQPLLSDHAFIMAPTWVIMPGQEIRNGKLMFRRFSLGLQKSNFDEVRAKGGGVEAIGPAGTLFNTMLYVCPRNEIDHLTFHMPDQVELNSFGRDGRVPSLQVNIRADASATKFEAEYIKGDLFVDADGSGHLKDFLDLLDASDITVEFGERQDQFHLFVGNTFASVKLADFLRGALPTLLQKKPSAFKFLSTEQMLKACANYKKSGKY